MKNFNTFVKESQNSGREITEFEKEVFLFLNELRIEGVVNMYGAVPYIIDEFDIDKKEASKLLGLWTRNFNEEGDYDFILDI